MSIFSLFISPFMAVFEDDVQNPTDSVIASELLGDEPIKHHVLYKRIEHIALDDGDTRSITFSDWTLSEWVVLYARVIGAAVFNLTGKDTNGVTTINSYIPVNGTEDFPGIIAISTYNLTAIQVEGEFDDTVVELLACIACESDDARLTTNA